MSLQFSLTPSRLCRFYGNTASKFQEKINLPPVPIRDNSKINTEFSIQSQRKIKKAINWLVYLSAPRREKIGKNRSIPNFRVAFVTLTLPNKQMHTHRQIVSKCLNRFLTVARQKWGIQNYVWKAELQQNGNIHFHITWDKYIHYMAIRREWNAAIEKLGYVSAYQKRHSSLTFEDYYSYQDHDSINAKKKAKKRYHHGNSTNWRSPNTTDVHKVADVDNLAAYLSKYVGKSIGNSHVSEVPEESKGTHIGQMLSQLYERTGTLADSITDGMGRAWFCSQSLSRMATAVFDFCSEFSRFYAWLSRFTENEFFINEFCSLVSFRLTELPDSVRDFLREQLVSHAINRDYPFPSLYPR